MKKVHGLLYSVMVGAFGATAPAVAWGQTTPAAPPTVVAPAVPPAAPAEPAPVAPTAEVATPAPVEPAPAPEPMQPVVTAPAEEVAPVEAVAVEAAPEAPAENKFVITTGFGLRSSLAIVSHDPKNDAADGGNGFKMDELSVEPRFSGKVTDIVGWTANFQASGQSANSVANYGGAVPPSNGALPYRFEVQAMDLVAQLDFIPEFHLWFGRMLTPSDRSNFSGPWFMSPWNYPGSYFVGGGPYVGPRGTEEIGREVGAVAWGDIDEGKFKYYFGVMDLDNPELSPLVTGRLGLALIGKEPGFYGSSTYYGSQDILALGVGAQYQKQSTVTATEALKEFNADALAEFNIAGAGTLTGELAYYNLDGPAFPVEGAFMALASYTTEKPIGPGKIQPLIRFQNTMNPDHMMFDFWLSYVMKDYFAKLALGYTMANIKGPMDEETKTNLVQFGFQVQQ